MSVNKSFLQKFEYFWFTLSNEYEELLQRGVFIGKIGKSDPLNFFLILQNCISGHVSIVPKVPILMFLKRWLISNIVLRNA